MALSTPAQCSKHTETAATDTCSRCGRFACNACLSASSDLTRCDDCVARDGGSIEVPCAWERRSEIGVWPAYIQTVKLMVTEPTKFWNQFPKQGPMGDAFWFAWINTLVAAVLAALFFKINFGPALGIYKSLPNMPEAVLKIIDFIQESPFQAGGLYGLFMVVIFPLGIVLGAGLYQLFLLPWSAGSSGFEATFRVMCYVSFASVVAGVPAIGILGALYQIVMMCWGLVKVHRTTPLRVIAALLSPGIFIACCVCGVGIFAGIASARR